MKAEKEDTLPWSARENIISAVETIQGIEASLAESEAFLQEAFGDSGEDERIRSLRDKIAGLAEGINEVLELSNQIQEDLTQEYIENGDV